jgi:hypothetical protein
VRDSSRQTLEAFVIRARKLVESRFGAFIQEGLEITLSFKQGWEGMRVEYKGPDAESIDAFILTFRFFIQDKDRISFRSLAQVCDDPDISDVWKDKFSQIRTALNEFLNETPPAPEKIPNNRRIMDVFIYGHLAHEDEEKKQQFDEWRATPAKFLFFNHQFNLILAEILRMISFLLYWTEEEIKGSMSRVV